MSSLRLYGLLMLTLLGFACSSDDGSTSGSEKETVPVFQVIGADENSLFLYTSAREDEEGSILNLSASGGINRQYITLRQTGDLLSFYRFASDNFSVVFHDVGNNTSVSYPNFYTVSDDRAITWGSNSEDHIFLGFYSPRGTRNYNVRILDPVSGNTTDVPVEEGTTQVFQPMYSNGRLVLPYRDGATNYKIAVLDTDSASVLQTLDFGSASTSMFLNSLDELVVLSSSNQLNYQFNFYDLNNASDIGQGNFVLNKFFPPGPVDATISANKLYYQNIFPQPYPVVSGPAVFDIGTREDLVIDILGIKLQVETEVGGPIILTDIHFLENAGLFVVGYEETANGPEARGGVVLIRPNGQEVSRIELPFVPTYVVRE